jgi:S1-C subfamily serine protease
LNSHLVLVLALWAAAAPAQAQSLYWQEPSDAPATAAPTASRSAWIGVWLIDEVDGGARIVALVPGSPAERASLLVGDIIVRANSRAVPEQETLSGVLSTLAPGATLDLQLLRAGQSVERSVQLAARPDRALPHAPPLALRAAERLPRRGLDIEVSAITPALREHYGAPADASVLVVRTDQAGAGARSGIRVGDVLIRVGDEPIVDVRQVQWIDWPLPGEEAALTAEIVRDGKRQSLPLAALESASDPAQDVEARRRAEREAVATRLRLELGRLERRMEEIRRELARLEAGSR